MVTTTIRVEVVGKVHEYAQDIAGFGTFLADGGKVVGIDAARREAKSFFRANRDETWKGLTYWVAMDDSGLAYRVELNRHGSWTIQAAAPMPGIGNVKDLYVA